MRPDLTPIYDLPLSNLRCRLEEMGERPFHADQIFRWLYQREVSSFKEMTDLSKDLRRNLNETFTLHLPEKVAVTEGTDTQKWLLRLCDGLFVECVRIGSESGSTACLSTQTGCRLRCVFCASGRAQPVRNLSPGEIVGQLLHLVRAGNAITNLVLMGMGEPFHNYENLMLALDILQTPQGLRMGARRITVSTAGVVPEIYRFAGEGTQVNLAVSLNAPNDKLRRKLMPIARYYPLDRLLPACRYYVERTRRRLSFEYVLIQGINDARSHASELPRLLESGLFHVNLIPYNPIESCRLHSPKGDRVRAFAEWLRRSGVAVTVRRSPGRDIHAACGQLAGQIREERSER